MEFDVWDPSKPDVSFKPADVSFPAFEFYKEQAGKIAEYIQSVEVTEKNVKEVKKDLAQARKITDELNARRIQIKKAVLENFDRFEEEVKALAAIISEAEEDLRKKVRAMEEEERRQKRDQIRQLWNSRIGGYQIASLVPEAFEVWMNPKYLNKSTSLKKAEEDMTSWLEDTEGSINVLRAMGEEYLVEYLGVLDMKAAITNVNRRKEIRDAVKESSTVEEMEETATFIITGEKDIAFTELLLTKNNIKYIRR